MFGQTDFLGDIRWVRVLNGAGETIPAFSLVRVTGADSDGVLTVEKPDADSQDVIVVGPEAIEDGEYGIATYESPVFVRYDDDETPALDEAWGAAADSFELTNGNTGFTIVGSVADGLVMVRKATDAGSDRDCYVRVLNNIPIAGRYLGQIVEVTSPLPTPTTYDDVEPCWIEDIMEYPLTVRRYLGRQSLELVNDQKLVIVQAAVMNLPVLSCTAVDYPGLVGANSIYSVLAPDGNVWSIWDHNAPGYVSKMTPAGAYTNYTTTSFNASQFFTDNICVGPDGKLWFILQSLNKVGSIDTDGNFGTEYTFPTTGGVWDGNTFSLNTPAARGICTGPDGNLWMCASGYNKIMRMDVAGNFTEYTVTTSNSKPVNICAGPDGNLWFCEYATNKIAKITPGGTITEYTVTTSSTPHSIIVGPDGNLWFILGGASRIAKITPGGTITEYSSGLGGNMYGWCAVGDGCIWGYLATGGVRRIAMDGTITTPCPSLSISGVGQACIDVNGKRNFGNNNGSGVGIRVF